MYLNDDGSGYSERKKAGDACSGSAGRGGKGGLTVLALNRVPGGDGKDRRKTYALWRGVEFSMEPGDEMDEWIEMSPLKDYLQYQARAPITRRPDLLLSRQCQLNSPKPKRSAAFHLASNGSQRFYFRYRPLSIPRLRFFGCLNPFIVSSTVSIFRSIPALIRNPTIRVRIQRNFKPQLDPL